MFKSESPPGCARIVRDEQSFQKRSRWTVQLLPTEGASRVPSDVGKHIPHEGLWCYPDITWEVSSNRRSNVLSTVSGSTTVWFFQLRGAPDLHETTPDKLVPLRMPR